MARIPTISPEQDALCKLIWRKGMAEEKGLKLYKPTENDCLTLRLTLYRARRSWETSDPLLFEALQGMTIKELRNADKRLIGVHVVSKNDLFEGLAELLGDIDLLPEVHQGRQNAKKVERALAEKAESFENSLLEALSAPEPASESALERAEALLKNSKSLFQAYTNNNQED